MKHATLAILAVLLVASSALAAPSPRDDFGDANFGLEPNPPSADLPSPSIPDAELGSLLEIALGGLQAGDQVTTTLGDGTMLLSVLDTNALKLDLISPAMVKSMELPPVPDTDLSDVTLLVTPATISVDRIGDNPSIPNTGGDLDVSQLRDGSITSWGAVTDISTVADDPAGRIVAPAHVTKTAELHDMVPVTDPVTDLIMLDPDDNLLFGTLAQHTAQLPLTDDLYVSKTDIQNALSTNAFTDLSIDGVLSGLKASTKELGAVDVSKLADTMAVENLALRRVSLPTPDPKTIMDLDSGELVLVDGGLGKITSLAGATAVQFDSDLLTQLKDPESVKDTAIHYVSKDNLDLTKRKATALFDARVGNYEQLLEKQKALLQHGISTEIAKDLTDCKARMQAKMAMDTPNLCSGPDLPEVSLPNARLLHYVGAIDKDGLMAKVAGIKDGAKPALVGTPEMKLKDMPKPSPDVPSVGSFGFSPDLPNLKGFTMPSFQLPDKGVGSLPDVDSLDADVPSVDPDLDFPESPNVLHGIFEAWDMGFLPGLVSVVPLDAATSAFGAVADLTTGNGLMAMPATLLQGLPLGTTSELTLRYVGESGSIFSNQGIEGVRVQMTSGDPLGMTKTTNTHESNLNGYVVVPVASLGTWSAVGSHDDYQDVTTSGQAPPPGQESGQEVTMEANSGNAAADFARSNSTWLLLALIAVVLLVVFRDDVKKLGKKTGRKRGGKGGRR